MTYKIQEIPIEVSVREDDDCTFYKTSVYEDGRETVEFITIDFPQNDIKRQIGRKTATHFIHYALEIEANKNFLKWKFPRSVVFPKDTPNWNVELCSFCLGSKLCAEIYGEDYEEPSEEKAPRFPLLSIILHLKRETLFKLFAHLHVWFLNVGMEKCLGRWIYAVLACIKKPIPSRFRNLLEAVYVDYVKHIEDSDDESERSRLYMFLGILDYQFGVSFDEI